MKHCLHFFTEENSRLCNNYRFFFLSNSIFLNIDLISFEIFHSLEIATNDVQKKTQANYKPYCLVEVE